MKFIKFLTNNKLYTFINVIGLSISLMFVILISNYAIKEYTLDSFHKDADRIYALGNENIVGTAYRIGGILQNRYPEIEKTCGVIDLWNRDIEASKIKVQGNIIAVDSTFFNFFSFKLLTGSENNPLASKNKIVISERLSKKLFNNVSNPIGQFVTVADSLPYIVSGIFNNFENTVLPDADIIMNIDNMTYFNELAISESLGNAGSTTMFLKVSEKADLFSKTDDMLEYFKTFFWTYQENNSQEVTLTQMCDLYFSPIHTNFKRGDKDFTNLLFIVGIIILVFSIFNYINLTVAQTGFRAKEMAVNRLFGASKQNVLMRMIFQSILLCGASFLIGFTLAIAAEPYINNLIDADISIIGNLSALWIGAYIALVIIVGILSGIIPALTILSFAPINVLKGTFLFKSKMVYSKLFIIVQSTITVVLIACSITMTMQVKHLISADLGYNKDRVLTIFVQNIEEAGAVRSKLESMSIIEKVGYCLTIPRGGEIARMAVEGIKDIVVFNYQTCDSNTVDILDFKVVQDNHLTESGVWLNETAMKQIGADKNTSSFSNQRGKQYKIKGVIKDYKTGDITSQNLPQALFMVISENIKPSIILAKISNGVDLQTAYLEIKKQFENATNNAEFEAEYMDKIIAENYKDQDKTATIMLIFTFIAIVISSLGLFAMAIYFTKQRYREVAVRKVFGSTRKQALVNSIWKFMRMIILAFVVACPIVWVTMNDWLQHFSYRINLSIWIFLVAGFSTALISFITVYWQSKQVSNIDPIKIIGK